MGRNNTSETANDEAQRKAKTEASVLNIFRNEFDDMSIEKESHIETIYSKTFEYIYFPFKLEEGDASCWTFSSGEAKSTL